MDQLRLNVLSGCLRWLAMGNFAFETAADSPFPWRRERRGAYGHPCPEGKGGLARRRKHECIRQPGGGFLESDERQAGAGVFGVDQAVEEAGLGRIQFGPG